MFEKCKQQTTDKQQSEWVRQEALRSQKQAQQLLDQAAKNMSLFNLGFELANLANERERFAQSDDDKLLVAELLLAAIEVFLKAKDSTSDPKIRDLIQHNCADLIRQAEELKGISSTDTLLDTLLDSLPSPPPNNSSKAASTRNTTSTSSPNKPPTPRGVIGVSTQPKNFANLRRTDPEFSFEGKFGRDFTRAQTLLQRGVTEIRQGMVAEAQTHNLDGVDILIRIVSQASDPESRRVLRAQCDAVLSEIEKLRSLRTQAPARPRVAPSPGPSTGGGSSTTEIAGGGIVLTGAQVKRLMDAWGDKPFTDNRFPANASILGDAQVPPISGWLRPHEAYDNPEVFKGGVSATDIHQGVLGDCWLMCVLGCLATRPKLFKRLVAPQTLSIKGIYAIRVFIEGETRFVIVDDLLPYTAFKGEGAPINPRGLYPVFATSHEIGELWVSLVEKACAKMLGEYGNLRGNKRDVPGKSSRQSFIDLTGGFAESECLSADDDKGKIFQKILRRRREGWLMSCGSKLEPSSAAITQRGHSADEGISSSGIVFEHAYIILEVVEAAGHQLLKLRNPWGRQQWKGQWGPGSKAWQTDAGKAIIAAMSKSARTEHVDGGTFWIDFSNFCEYFEILHYCRLFDGMHSQLVRGQWSGANRGGQEYYPSWRNNPQFDLTITHPTNLFVVLEQGDPRFCELEQQPISFSIWRSTTPGKRMLDSPEDSLVERAIYARAEVYCDLRQVLPGRYTIVAATIRPDQTQRFTIRAYAPAKTFTIQPLQSDWVEETVSGKWAAADADLVETLHRNNPKFSLTVEAEQNVFLSPSGPVYKTPLALHFETCGHVKLPAGQYVLWGCSRGSLDGESFALKAFSDAPIKIASLE
eukprot:c19216_g1_i1.p1 GENE.c19216_g1_i1~~c19216_g1_i1.p1  ORF type:complete len:908 (+),score=177.18 c19216_g1_i1:126-2726(+)